MEFFTRILRKKEKKQKKEVEAQNVDSSFSKPAGKTLAILPYGS